MNLRKNIKKNKEGSYILEASITLPILIISICSLILVIKAIMICESITFHTSKNMIDTMFGRNIGFSVNPLCNEMKEIEDSISSFKVTKYRYLYSEDELNDLIAFDAKAEFNIINAIGINGNINFSEKILCRGFTGNLQNGIPLEEDEFLRYEDSIKVYIFPKYGEKYHQRNCRYIKINKIENGYIREIDREDALRKGYIPCVVCKGAAYEK